MFNIQKQQVQTDKELPKSQKCVKFDDEIKHFRMIPSGLKYLKHNGKKTNLNPFWSLIITIRRFIVRKKMAKHGNENKNPTRV